MKWIMLFSLLVAFASGFFLGYYLFNSEPEVRIIETVVTKTQYFADPQSLKDYKECYDSPITITAEAHGDKLNVYVTDSCKSAEAEIGIACGGKISLSTGAMIFGSGVAVGSMLFLIFF
jgi:hypothetical protein